MIVPTGPSHTTNAMAFLDFLEAAANDPRWSADGMMPEIERNFDLGLDDKLIYRFLIIPIAKERVLEQAHDFAWIHTHGRPAWGPGRDGPFNLTKFNLLGLPDDDTVDNADFPSIWNAGLRENTSLNWAGETQDPLAVYIDSRPRHRRARRRRSWPTWCKHREYLRAKQPPPYPFPIDAGAGGRRARTVWAANCADCHAPGGARFGRTVPRSTRSAPTASASTPGRQANADATNAKARELGVERKAMVKDVGYASQPLDGIWLRAPYLHNGSVPSLTALLDPPDERPTSFWRGCDIYDPVAVGFRSHPVRRRLPARSSSSTPRERGNGNGGHALRHRPAPRGQGGAGRVPQDALKATRAPLAWPALPPAGAGLAADTAGWRQAPRHPPACQTLPPAARLRLRRRPHRLLPRDVRTDRNRLRKLF